MPMQNANCILSETHCCHPRSAVDLLSKLTNQHVATGLLRNSMMDHKVDVDIHPDPQILFYSRTNNG